MDLARLGSASAPIKGRGRGTGSMQRYQPKRIGYSDASEYEGVYEFYKRLERRQKADSLWKIAMAVSVPVMLWMSAWCATQYIEWSPLAQPMRVASSGATTE